jgi:anti-sigma regulatory factor (Ser/Thr protein kinase)
MKTLHLPGTLESLPLLGEYVAAAAVAARLDNRAAYRLRLAVDEIATNAVVHGYAKATRSGLFVITATIAGPKLTILLQDSSPPYDPRQTPPPQALDRPPQERPSGGLGIYLALQGVDAYHYEYENGRNCHTFDMNRKQA